MTTPHVPLPSATLFRCHRIKQLSYGQTLLSSERLTKTQPSILTHKNRIGWKMRALLNLISNWTCPGFCADEENEEAMKSCDRICGQGRMRQAMKYDDFFGGQKVKILSGPYKDQIATVSEPSQEMFGMKVHVGEGPYIHLPCEAFEAIDVKPPSVPLGPEYYAAEEEWESDKASGRLDD